MISTATDMHRMQGSWVDDSALLQPVHIWRGVWGVSLGSVLGEATGEHVK